MRALRRILTFEIQAFGHPERKHGRIAHGDHFDARMLFGTAIALAGVLLILLKPRKTAHLLSTVSTSMAQRP